MDEAADKLRLDKWLWHARFFKTRSLAARIVAGGHVRVNATRVAKPAFAVAPDDVLTFSKEGTVRVVRIVALGARRGPAPEARALYKDLSPPAPEPQPAAPGSDRQGRPTKRDRRKLDQARRGTLE